MHDPSDLLSARARAMSPSVIRALFSAADRPGTVSLAGGMPTPEALPSEILSVLAAEVVRDRPAALQYGGGRGDPVLREQICELMADECIVARPDDVIVTVGSQQALDLVTTVVVDPGDVVLVDTPAYVGALGTFAGHRAQVRHVPGDAYGMLPDRLADAIAAAGRPPKMLYTVPTFANPTGITTGGARRAEVLTICRRAGVLVVEDDPYGLLRLAGEPEPALRALDPGVVRLGSFSKTLAPGLRVGWVTAPPAVLDKVSLATEASVLCHSGLGQLVASEYLRREPWDQHLKAVRELYWERREAMLDALATTMPDGTSWTRPDGGFFVWLGLPPGVDATELLPRALDAGVAYVPGTGFHADGGGHGHMRLSWSFPDPGQITEGITRLARVIDESRATS